jgi:transposase InsO family protein
MAVNRQFPDGAGDRGLSLMSDNGCQPALMAFMETCSTLGIHQAVTSSNNPKSNADTERVIRTFKEEGLWLQEWSDPFLGDQHTWQLDRGLQRALFALSPGVQNPQAI